MKIIQIVLGKANPNRMNGVNNVVHNISTSLNRKETDVEVWGITSSKENDDFKREYKLKTFDSFTCRLIPSLSLIKSVMKEDENNVKFHFHGAYIVEFFVLSIFLKMFKYKWFVTPHGGYSKNTLLKNTLLKKIYIKTFDRIYVGQSQKVQALAVKEREDILECFPGLDVDVIANGVNIPETNNSRSTSSTERYFVFCGRLHRQKGLDYLLDGYVSYLSSGGSTKLYIIGDGDELAYINKFISSHSLKEQVVMLGALFNEEKNQVISNAISFVSPSRFEGFPIALLEAFSLNLPVIVSEETNFGDIVIDNDLGIKLKDTRPDTIRDALLNMDIKSDKYYGDRPRKFVQEHYSWDAITSKLSMSLYNI